MARKRRSKLSWRRQVVFLKSALTLAGWRWRQQWFLLLMTGLGITTAIVLVGSLPLFSNVMTTAGLRNVLRAQPNSAQIVAATSLPGFSSNLVQQASDLVNNQVRQDAGQYLQGRPQVEVQTPAWGFPPPGRPYTVSLYGAPFSVASSHIHLLQGRLPVENASHIEILLTRSEAQSMGVTLGGDLTLQAGLLDAPLYSDRSKPPYALLVTLHVVGIFQADGNDAYWDGNSFEAPFVSSMSQPPPPFLILTSSSILFSFFDTLAQQRHTNGIFSGASSGYLVYLAYSLNTAGITSNDLDDVIKHLYTLQRDIPATFNSVWDGYNPQSPYINNVDLSGPTLSNASLAGSNASTLEKFRTQEFIESTPALLLTAQIVCLILFFVSMMSGALVEQQQQAIAVMRSRGASRGQILGSLAMQGSGICLLAGLVGPILAIGLVPLVAPLFLTARTRDALNVLTLNAGQTLSGLGRYTLAAVAATLGTMIFSLYLAVRANILTHRSEATRATRRPLWQRLQLDLVLAVLALLSYAMATSVEGTNQALSPQGQTLVSVPMELLAPLLLIVAGILFFLRLFPYLLRLLSWLTQRRSSLSSMLALVQMERAPRQPMRMALLLGLATAFVIFSLVFSASQGQRGQDLARYQVGGDFSGALFLLPNVPPGDPISTLASTTARYQQIKGVKSATAGYTTNTYFAVNSGTSNVYMQGAILQAVNAGTFAQTVSWNVQDSGQPLSTLMAQLVNQRQQAIARDIVPAFVAASTWQLLGLHPGSLFHLTDDEGNPNSVTYVALAELAHIPPVDDSSQGAVLVDYQTLAAANTRVHQIIQPNYVWLSSGDNPADVAAIRSTLTSGTFNLVHLLDRRALTEANVTDPLAGNLLTILTIGGAAALLLSLLANMLLPVLNMRARLTNFAVLRALGTEPAQVTRILTWEQGIVLATALLLGLLFGTLLAWTAVPPLIFTGISPVSAIDASNTAIFALQRIIPVAIALPASLGLALAALIVMCLLALSIVTRLARRPLMGQALRLNED